LVAVDQLVLVVPFQLVVWQKAEDEATPRKIKMRKNFLKKKF